MQRQQEQLDARSWGDGCGPGQSRRGRCGGAPGVCWPRAGPPGLRRQKGWRTGGQTCSQVRRRALCSWLALVCRALGVGPGGPAQCGGGWVSPQDCCLVASGELPHSEGLASGSGFSARWLANVEPTSVRGPDEGQEVAFHLGQLAFCSGKGRQGRGPGTHEARGRPCSGALAALWPQQWGRGLPENMMSHQHPPVTLGRSHPIIWWAVIAGVFSDHFCAR